MNAIDRVRSAYSPTAAAPIRSAQSTEYDVFAQITRRMKQAEADGAAGFPALAAALHDNRRLWSVLATDVAGDDNALPAELRAKLFYLAEFTAQHSDKVLAGEGAAGVLVDINTAVMRGLRHQDGSA